MNITQRADLTFKHNVNQSRHGWLRLTPAYSVKLVSDILQQFDKKLTVFDPFSGTATTPLTAVTLGHIGYACEINPFLVWLGNAKLRNYTKDEIEAAIFTGERIENNINTLKPIVAPSISHIERWWTPEVLDYLCKVKKGIDDCDQNQNVKNLLLVAFCKTLIELASVSYGHQSVSFKKEKTSHPLFDWFQTPQINGHFLANLAEITKYAKEKYEEKGQVFHCDSRSLEIMEQKNCDIVITSPPYPNRMSYIRELRPYMYWLGYLQNTQSAGVLDWETIGGTWGCATSKLNDWSVKDELYLTETVRKAVNGVENCQNKSGVLMAIYIKKYFYDMYQHFKSMYHLFPNVEMHYIIGNSKFYDCMVDAEIIYSELLELVGFKHIEINTIRKRNSKKELFEFDVVVNKY